MDPHHILQLVNNPTVLAELSSAFLSSAFASILAFHHIVWEVKSTPTLQQKKFKS
jgi:hypothetical protein